MEMTAARLGAATEEELLRRIKNDKATPTERALYGEVQALRAAIRDRTLRLAVAFPKQIDDLYEEQRKTLRP